MTEGVEYGFGLVMGIISALALLGLLAVILNSIKD